MNAFFHGSTVFVMPTPPSVNQLFRNVPGKGRVKTRVYDDWRAHAVTMIRTQGVGPFVGNVLVVFAVERMSLASDIDNRIKAMLDAIVDARVIADDRHVTGFCAAWAPPANGLAHVQILPVGRIGIEFHPSIDRTTGGWFPVHQPEGDDNGFVHI